MAVLSIAGAYIPWFTQYTLAPVFEVNGMADIAAIVSSNEFTFIFAIIYYLICALIISRGAKTTTRVLWAFFILVLIGLIVYAGGLIIVGNTGFAGNFTKATGVP